MHTSLFFVLAASLAFAGVQAHFQLAFPPPWGPFVEDDEPTFCDGYTSTNATRTPFPLSGGFFTLNSEHPKWTAGVLISTVSNPTSFNNFSQVNSFFQVSGEGGFCIPLDLSKSNATGLAQGENATIQIVFDGGDGQLYQCANVILENNSTLLSNLTCTNATSATPTSSTTPSTSTTQKSAGIHQNPVGLIGSLSVLTLLTIALTQG